MAAGSSRRQTAQPFEPRSGGCLGQKHGHLRLVLLSSLMNNALGGGHPEPAPNQAGSGLPQRGRWLLAGAALVALFVLLAIVALGTQAHYHQQLLAPTAKAAAQNPLTGALGQVFVIVLLGAAELLLVLMLIFFPWRDFRTIGKPGSPAVKIRRKDSLKLVALAFGMLIALVVFFILGLKRRTKPFHGVSPGVPGAAHAPRVVGNGSVPVGSDLVLASVVVVVVVVVFAAFLLVRRSSRWRSQMAGMTLPTGMPEELLLAVDGGLEELSAGGDPRQAVILAYSRLERSLAERGLVRQRFETHLEYLERALAGMNLNRATLARLTDLFHTARYSNHEVDLEMRREAESALSTLRSELVAN